MDKINVTIEESEDGGFVGFVKELPGVASQGETIEELKENIVDAIRLVLDYLKENNLDKSPIEEIVEIGTPSSLIKRKGEPTTELINTETLTNELNTHLKTYQWMLDKL